VLHELGLGDALAATAIETGELVYTNRLGQRIWTEPRGRGAGYEHPQYSIHRGELQLLLLAAVEQRLGPGAVRRGHALAAFDADAEAVTAELADRAGHTIATVRGQALIGADGIHSRVRALLSPGEGAPRYSGRILWRGLTRAPHFLTGRSMIMAGHPDQKFVCYPISRQAAEQDGVSLINWVAELMVPGSEPPQDWSREVDAAVFADRFADWRFDWLDVPALIAGAERIYEYPLADRDPLGRWTYGRVTLLGDAAHPMFPVGSNGASQAILDASAIAEALATTHDVGQALTRYEATRRPPTSQIVLANREHGPERVMLLAEERAPDGFERIEDVIPRAELEQIAASYKATAGFTPEEVNRR
jgi:2-polyprenyl-6-methoxyphenol hydroxylase-like FAD-dependent oxidoreductase